MRSITSHDGGLTWSEPKTEFEIPGGKAVFCNQALVTSSGQLHSFVLVQRGEGHRYGVDLFLDVWHWKTNSSDARWSQGVRIFEGVVGALRGVTQLESGRILLPVGMWITGRQAGLPTGAHEISVLYSDDSGDSWTMSSSRLVAPCYEGYNGSNYGACEPNVIELGNNRVWMLMRTQTGFLYQSFSDDGGVTWSDATVSEFISSDSPAEMLRTADGRLVVIWNNDQNPPRVDGKIVAGGRDALHAAISPDNGQTWLGIREIYRDPLSNASPPRRGDRGTAYSTAVCNDAGKIVVTTGQGENRRAILIFDPAWLLETHQEDDFSHGLAGWSTFTEFGPPEPPVFRDRAGGPELIENPSKSSSKVLHIRRPLDKPGDAAVWNFPAAGRGQLELRILLEKGFDGGNIALGDRFFNPSDTNGEDHAVFTLPIDAQGQLQILQAAPLTTDKWHALELSWNLAEQKCDVSVDGKHAGTLPLKNAANRGVSYLRIRSTADATDPNGMLLERVSMAASN
jgi:hypothetical protein